MATTDVEICNLALVHVGQTEFIQDLEEDDTAASRILSVLYEPMRDRLLEALWWPFATKQATLALLAGVTRAGWAGAYSLPTDCLAPQYISNGIRRGAPLATLSAVVSPSFMDAAMPLAGVGMRVPFTLELSDDGASRILLTDFTTPILVYTAKVTSPLVFPPGFVDALAYFLGARLASSLLKKPPLAKELNALAQAEVARAWAVVQRAQQEDVNPDSEFIAVRG